MLSSISAKTIQMGCVPPAVHAPSLYDRDEKEDMKKAIELLYQFKQSLSELHPNCLNLIEGMLQFRRF